MRPQPGEIELLAEQHGSKIADDKSSFHEHYVSSQALLVWDREFLKDSELKDQQLHESMNQ